MGERDAVKERETIGGCVGVCVCVCERERERERDKEGERERERESNEYGKATIELE